MCMMVATMDLKGIGLLDGEIIETSPFGAGEEVRANSQKIVIKERSLSEIFDFTLSEPDRTK